MAISLTPVPFLQAIAAMKARGIVLPAIYYSAAYQAMMRNYTFSIAGMANVSQLQQSLDSLSKAIEDGQSFEQWKKDVKANNYAVATLPPHRLDNIFRTNIQSQYNVGRAVNVVEHQKTRPYLMYSAVNDSRVRPSHFAWNGFVAKVTDRIWGYIYPPLKSNPYRCRCTVISLSERQAMQRMKLDKPNADRKTELKELVKFGSNSPLTKEFDIKAGLKEAAKPYKGGIFDSYLQQLGLINTVENLTPEQKLEKGIKDGIDYVLKNGKPLESDRIEFAYLVDKEGNNYLAKKGGYSEVSFTNEEMNIMQEKGGILIHNHPSGGSLSNADLRIQNYLNLNSIIAAGHNGIEYEAFVLDGKKLEKYYDTLHGAVKDRMNGFIDRKEISSDDSYLIINHTLNSVLHESKIINYSVKNKNLLKHQDITDKIVEGLDFLTNALKK